MIVNLRPQDSQPVTLQEILASVEPQVAGSLESGSAFRWIERDSREVSPGDLFIAIKGENNDGHRFIEQAAARGARAALVSREWFGQLLGAPGIPLLVVADPVTALQQIAGARRRSLPVTVVGVTGSIGKTSTKEAIAAGVRQSRSTFWSPGNMNSEIGLPLSILEIPAGTEIAVLEMGGAYAPGEVSLLASIAQPSIGVVTNVYPVHLERMGSMKAIAETKAELVEALPASGAAVLNTDNPYVAAMASRTSARVISYGTSKDADFRASSIRTHGLAGVSFTLASDSGHRQVRLPMVGPHAIELALAAIGAGAALHIDVDDVLAGLSDPGVQVRLVPLPGPNGSQLLDDTYNASSPSVMSALRLLSEIPCQRRIAVLGDMRELGSEAEVQHREVGHYAAQVADLLITFGELGKQIAIAAQDGSVVDVRLVDVQSFDLDQREDLTRVLLSELRSGDTALLKGSRGLEMETIVEALRGAAVDAGQDA